MSEMELYYLKEDVETELGMELSDGEFNMVLADWNAFAMNPRNYGSLVVGMVRQYISELRGMF